jgi:hypothetical protein
LLGSGDQRIGLGQSGFGRKDKELVALLEISDRYREILLAEGILNMARGEK